MSLPYMYMDSNTRRTTVLQRPSCNPIDHVQKCTVHSYNTTRTLHVSHNPCVITLNGYDRKLMFLFFSFSVLLVIRLFIDVYDLEEVDLLLLWMEFLCHRIEEQSSVFY